MYSWYNYCRGRGIMRLDGPEGSDDVAICVMCAVRPPDLPKHRYGPGTMPVSREHRWSGYPGAWCLDCGKADMLELGLSSQCKDCRASEGENGTMIFIPCLFHSNAPCRQPGSRKHDPYRKPEEPTSTK